jgi:hypothetical protein
MDFNMGTHMGLQGQANVTLAQQAQIQNAAQMARETPPQQPLPQTQQQPQQQAHPQGQALSPQSAARERARVSVLLEINTHLLQEVVSLQAQGKAGATQQGQQSPTSPNSGTDSTNALNNSPGDPPKSAGSKQPSPEYAECMRRLQANLSYLAAIADAKKKVNGAIPAGPTIVTAPVHLPQVHDLYKKLNLLFPEAGQQSGNKASAGHGVSQGLNPGARSQQPASISAHG